MLMLPLMMWANRPMLFHCFRWPRVSPKLPSVRKIYKAIGARLLRDGFGVLCAEVAVWAASCCSTCSVAPMEGALASPNPVPDMYRNLRCPRMPLQPHQSQHLPPQAECIGGARHAAADRQATPSLAAPSWPRCGYCPLVSGRYNSVCCCPVHVPLHEVQGQQQAYSSCY
jgi:hypothetical protein